MRGKDGKTVGKTERENDGGAIRTEGETRGSRRGKGNCGWHVKKFLNDEKIYQMLLKKIINFPSLEEIFFQTI